MLKNRLKAPFQAKLLEKIAIAVNSEHSLKELLRLFWVQDIHIYIQSKFNFQHIRYEKHVVSFDILFVGGSIELQR